MSPYDTPSQQLAQPTLSKAYYPASRSLSEVPSKPRTTTLSPPNDRIEWERMGRRLDALVEEVRRLKEVPSTPEPQEEPPKDDGKEDDPSESSSNSESSSESEDSEPDVQKQLRQWKRWYKRRQDLRRKDNRKEKEVMVDSEEGSPRKTWGEIGEGGTLLWGKHQVSDGRFPLELGLQIPD